MPCETVIRPGPCKKKDAEKAPVSVNRQTANDWRDWTVGKMRSYCKDLGLSGFTRLSKNKLGKLLNEAGASSSEE